MAHRDLTVSPASRRAQVAGLIAPGGLPSLTALGLAWNAIGGTGGAALGEALAAAAAAAASAVLAANHAGGDADNTAAADDNDAANAVAASAPRLRVLDLAHNALGGALGRATGAARVLARGLGASASLEVRE